MKIDDQTSQKVLLAKFRTLAYLVWVYMIITSDLSLVNCVIFFSVIGMLSQAEKVIERENYVIKHLDSRF